MEIPEKIWIEFKEDQYGNKSIESWSSEKNTGIEYTRQHVVPEGEETIAEIVWGIFYEHGKHTPEYWALAKAIQKRFTLPVRDGE